MQFSGLDWAIVVVYIVGSAAAGMLCRRFIHTLPDFLVARRKLNTSLAIATLSATEMGLVTVVYWAEQGYRHGFSAYALGLIWAACMTTVGLTGFIIKGLRQSGAMTIAEYYELRYGRGVRWFGGLVIAIGGILNTAVFLKYGALFLTKVTGLPKTVEVSLPLFSQPIAVPALNLTMTLVLIIVLAYTLAGGMVSVVVTDYIQFVILTLSLLVTTICVLVQVPFSEMAQAVTEHRGYAGFSPFANQDYGWIYLGYQFFVNTAAVCAWQPMAMRTGSAQNAETAQSVFRWTGLTFAGRAIIPMTWGIAAIAYFGTKFDALNKPPEAMPTMLGQIVPPGVLGILVAGMLAAQMSTDDSYLLAWSGVLVQDVIAPLRRKPLSEAARIRLMRLLMVAIGIFFLIWGLWYELPGSIWDYLTLTGTMYLAGALTLLSCGLYWKLANAAGAYAAIGVGAALPLAFVFLNKWLKLSPAITGMASYLLSFSAMVLGSLLGSANQRVNRK